MSDDLYLYGTSIMEQALMETEMLESALEQWGKLPRPGVRWQFKSGSLATIPRGMDLSSRLVYSAWDRQLGCEVLYDVEPRRGRRAA